MQNKRTFDLYISDIHIEHNTIFKICWKFALFAKFGIRPRTFESNACFNTPLYERDAPNMFRAICLKRGEKVVKRFIFADPVHFISEVGK